QESNGVSASDAFAGTPRQFEFSDDRSFRVRLTCPYKAAADWTLVRDLEDSPSIRQVEVAYGL
uniref:hypothetical protein n=1 Tax=Parasutterella excrementihominis TaxID=487175 RepID=UPI00242E0F27